MYASQDLENKNLNVLNISGDQINTYRNKYFPDLLNIENKSQYFKEYFYYTITICKA